MSIARSLARLAYLAAGAIVVFAPILRELAPPGSAGSGLSTVQFLAFEVCLALFSVFIRSAAHATGPFQSATAAVLAIAAAACGAWIVRFLGTERAVFLPLAPDVVGVACFLLGSVVLASYLAGGRQIGYLAAAAFVLGYLGQFIGGGVSVPSTPFASYVNYLIYGSDGLLGRALDIMVNPVMAFVVFGAFYEASGGGRAISRVALRISDRSRSGAVRACILASGMFGAISGTAVSNVMTTGVFSIPSMRRVGVRNETAAGIEAAASTGGQIMPPVMGAAAFILTDFTGETYATVVAASLLPALGVYFAMFRQADLLTFDQAQDRHNAGPERLPGSLLLYVFPPSVLVLLLIGSNLQPGRAALAGAACSLAVSLVVTGARESLRHLRRGFEKLVNTGLQLIVIAAAMGLVLGVLNATGLAVAATVGLSDLGQDNLGFALIVAAGSAFVLGIGMATVGVYVLAAAMLAPGLIAAGVPPLAAHFFLLYCGILSMLTPPVALASLAASALSKADFTATALAAMRFGWILFVMPFIIVLQPGLVLLGGWLEVGCAALVSCVFIVAATQPGLKPGLRAGVVAVAGAGILWRGSDWVTLATSLALAAFLLGRSRLLHR